MTLSGPAHRTRTPPLDRVTRSLGYLFAIALNMLFLYVVNAWPGWQILPFLAQDTQQVLSLLNLALAAGIALNAAYLAYDPPWFKDLGYLLADAFGLAVLVRTWQVFPFDFTGWAVLLIHAFLVVAIVVIAIGMVTNLVLLVRARRYRQG
jgi:hypothetical protein